jgi:CBS domain-containing protein
LVTVPADATLQEVAEELALDEVGVVVVERDGDPVGVVSERDVVAAIAADGDLDTQAADMMSMDLVTAPDHTAVVDVARLMIEARVRHVLVRDDKEEGGRLAAIVSIRDLVELLLDVRT